MSYRARCQGRRFQKRWKVEWAKLKYISQFCAKHGLTEDQYNKLSLNERLKYLYPSNQIVKTMYYNFLHLPVSTSQIRDPKENAKTFLVAYSV